MGSPACALSTAASTVSVPQASAIRSAREGFETAVIAAVAGRAVRIDRLMADLTRRAIVAELDAAIDGDHPADSGSQHQPDHGGCPPAGAQPEFCQAEGSSVVDHGHRDPEGGCNGRGNRSTCPSAGDVHQEPGGARSRVIQSRNPDARRDDTRPLVDRRSADGTDRLDDGVWPGGCRRPDLTGAEGSPRAVGQFDDRPFHVGAAEVQPEVPGHGQIGSSRAAVPCGLPMGSGITSDLSSLCRRTDDCVFGRDCARELVPQ